MPELRHLRLIAEVAATGSLAAAARKLGFSQPAASQQMRLLERTMRTPLVLREHNGTRLTQAGQTLVEHSEQILAQLARAKSDVAAIAGLKDGYVRVVAFPSSNATIVPKALALVRGKYPDLTYSLIEAEPPKSLELLLEGDCEVVIGYRHPGSETIELPGILQVPLYQDVMHLGLPPNHPLREHDEPIPLAELKDEAWIAGCPQCREQLVTACQEAGFDPQIAFSTDDYVALHNLVSEGLGIALLSDLMLSSVRFGDIDLQTVTPPPVREIIAYTTRPLSNVPAVRATLSALLQTSNNLKLSPLGGEPQDATESPHTTASPQTTES
ncbi:MAG TPA: LysR substrate-binding domain-containing protein [Actinomycetales bacterium]|nr:LysR substrate-binding domain-containing protein [Actinomycetales bacterium]